MADPLPAKDAQELAVDMKEGTVVLRTLWSKIVIPTDTAGLSDKQRTALELAKQALDFIDLVADQLSSPDDDRATKVSTAQLELLSSDSWSSLDDLAASLPPASSVLNTSSSSSSSSSSKADDDTKAADSMEESSKLKEDLADRDDAITDLQQQLDDLQDELAQVKERAQKAEAKAAAAEKALRKSRASSGDSPVKPVDLSARQAKHAAARRRMSSGSQKFNTLPASSSQSGLRQPKKYDTSDDSAIANGQKKKKKAGTFGSKSAEKPRRKPWERQRSVPKMPVFNVPKLSTMKRAKEHEQKKKAKEPKNQRPAWNSVGIQESSFKGGVLGTLNRSTSLANTREEELLEQKRRARAKRASVDPKEVAERLFKSPTKASRSKMASDDAPPN